MKNRTLVSIFFILIILNFTAKAQVGINATNTPPAASAMLDVSSTSKGFLPPRMSTAQRNTLTATAATGLIVYDTDENELYINTGTWKKIIGIDAPLVLNSSTGRGIDVSINSEEPAGYFYNPSGNAINANSGQYTAVLGTSSGVSATGYFQNLGGGTGLNVSARNGKAIIASNNSAANPTLFLANSNANGNALVIYGQIKIPSEQTNKPIFVHITSASNSFSNYTLLNYPNAQSTDFLIVTPTIGNQTYSANPHPISTNYANGNWNIFNSDGSPMTVNTAFNVLVIKQ